MTWFQAVVATVVMTMVCGHLAGGAARAEALHLSGGLTGATRTAQMTQPVQPSIVIRPVPGSETVSDSDPPEPLPPSPEESAADRAMELAYWNTARESRNPMMLRAYLNRYPDGAFSELAELLLEQF
jgi:hypothetical protein